MKDNKQNPSGIVYLQCQVDEITEHFHAKQIRILAEQLVEAIENESSTYDAIEVAEEILIESIPAPKGTNK